MLAMAGVPEEIAIQLVGHANAKMIHEVYMASSPKCWKMLVSAGCVTVNAPHDTILKVRINNTIKKKNKRFSGAISLIHSGDTSKNRLRDSYPAPN